MGDASKAEKIDMNFSFTRDLQSEFKQMFGRDLGKPGEIFYDDDLLGVDWKRVSEAV
jgi:tricorn protease